MTPTAQHYFVIRKRIAVSFVVLNGVIILLGLLSYFWLPGYAKSQIEIRLSEMMHRPVTIESINIQLFSLEFTVDGFQIGERKTGNHADERFFSFDQLYVDLSAASITQRAPIISAITLKTPTLRLIREDQNHFNITDLIETLTQPSTDDEINKPEIPSFSISNIIIAGGHLEFVDRFKQSHQEIADINLGIPFVANFTSTEAIWVQPHFNAKVNGAPFSLDGKLRPFMDEREAVFEIKLTNIDLTDIDEYAPTPIGISLLSGYFDSDLELTFKQMTDELPSLTLSGHATLRQLAFENQAVEAPYQVGLEQLDIQLTEIDLTGRRQSQMAAAADKIALTRKSESVPALSLSKLTVSDIQVNIEQQKIGLNKILLDRFNVSMRREKDGHLDLIRLFTASLPDAAMPVPGYKPAATDKIRIAPEQAMMDVAIPVPGHKPAVTDRIRVAQKQLMANAVIPIPAHKPAVADRIRVTPKQAMADAASVADSAQPVKSAQPSWVTEIKQIRFTAGSFRFEDAALTKVAPMVVDSLNLTLDRIDLSGAQPLNLALQARLNEYGSIDTQGSLAWAPLAVNLDVDLKEMDVVSLQGWAGDHLNALLTDGAVSFQGKVAANGEPLKVVAKGQGRLSNFNIFDQVSASDLLRWKSLDVTGIHFINEPLRVDMTTVKLDDFFARVMLSPEGDLNLKAIIRQEDQAEAVVTENTVASASSQPAPIYIDQVILQNGRVNFRDQFIKPNYRANLTGLTGQIGPLKPDRSGTIDIQGAVDKSAPLAIRGNIDPFSSELLLNITAQVKDIDLPSFSPYSGKYVGYTIKKGKLSVDVHYEIEAGVLKAKNNIFLDQLTLGEQTDSPEALSIPLRLAIALLKNRRGEIDIHLPVRGSFDDPQFSLGKIIFDAFINLVMKAATAPFALLGSVLGDGEELSMINFVPGQAQIAAEAEKRLEALSQALIDRPALKLEITGYASPEHDYEGLKQMILERKVKAQKLVEETERGEAGGALDDIELDSGSYDKYLELVYKNEEFEKPTNILGFTKSLPVPEMEQLILAHIEIDDNDLKALADQRARAARDWLVARGGVAHDRIFVLDAKIKIETGNKTEGGQVKFSVR